MLTIIKPGDKTTEAKQLQLEADIRPLGDGKARALEPLKADNHDHCLEAWWQRHQTDYPNVEEWVIDLDNGPALNSHRTQFIKRMVEFQGHQALC